MKEGSVKFAVLVQEGLNPSSRVVPVLMSVLAWQTSWTARVSCLVFGFKFKVAGCVMCPLPPSLHRRVDTMCFDSTG